VNFAGLLTLLNEPEKKEFKRVLGVFVEDFLPKLQTAKKYKQLIAELENLEHIKSCADDMLNENGLNFKPKFVAKIVIHRINIAMFGFSNEAKLVVEDGQYEPFCMWDFGKDRAFVNLKKIGSQGDENLSGTFRTPSKKNKKYLHQTSILGYNKDEGKTLSEYYNVSVNGDYQLTPGLRHRFRQYLFTTCKGKSLNEHQNGIIAEKAKFLAQELGINANGENCGKIRGAMEDVVSSILGEFDEQTPLLKLPPHIMFLVGLQFGQINRGSWNPFMVAAKKYLALQSNANSDNFFWNGEVFDESESILLEKAFGNLIVETNEVYDESIAEQFELALCAYYAMNQEILSRVAFAGNNRSACQIQNIYRLESIDALVGMQILRQDESSKIWQVSDKISQRAKRAFLVSCSNAGPVKSLDKPKDYPPPLTAITKYENVHMPAYLEIICLTSTLPTLLGLCPDF
jgi:hypothetical protein